MSESSVRGRFAPSPTGGLHLGLARTALLSWLGARSAGGTFILRLEDLDEPRVVPGAAASQMDDLRWLGLGWDEGPQVGGPDLPYSQSQRGGLYAQAVETLRTSGRAYPCTCSRKEVSLASAPHGPSDYGATYAGTCRDGPSHDDRPASIRFRVPDALPDFEDGVQGWVREQGAQGDFVIRRAGGLFSYQLAVVVDDALMGVNQVVRGADLLGCTGWQLALYEALGYPAPRFYHVPLLLGHDGERLSKRLNSTSVADYRKRGWTPERVLGWLASSLGWADLGLEISADELLMNFSWDRVPSEDTRLPSDQLP